MFPRVTAILVVHDGTGPNGSSHLQDTLDALAAQTRQPDSIIAVACASPTEAKKALEAAGVDRIVEAGDRLNFGAALAEGVRVIPQSGGPDEFLWLLAQDTTPAPDALERLVGALEVAPSVAVAGPKVLDARDGVTIVSLGQALTPLGATVSLVGEELDQGQHDAVSDVLGVSPEGMLIRHAVWEEVGGFDTAFGSTDDSLDFSVRVRLAGHRVVVVPPARVSTSGDGIAGPSRSRKASAYRKRARQTRGAQLHRRLVYAPAALVWLHWLSLVPLAVVRMVWRVATKNPGLVGGEFAAAFRVAFSPIRIAHARKNLHSAKTLGWSAISPLRIPFAEVRRRRLLRREAGAPVYTVERSDLRFFTGGGGWVVIASALVSVGLFFNLLAASAVEGGGMLPLSASVADLWQNIGFGWRDISIGFTGAADPFSVVMALLGTITFWQPSYALVLLTLLALPLATLGGWFAATRLTESSGYRIVAAVLWTVAPPFLTALIDGRPAAILVHLLLPWLFYAGSVTARSWAASAVASMLLAVTVACAPSLGPAFLVIWVLALFVSGRHIARIVWLIIPTAALFAPLIWQQGFVRGHWLLLLADPGAVVASAPTTGWQLALGLPGGNPAWDSITTALGLSGLPAHLLVPILLAPIAVMALLALFLPGSARAAVLLFVGLLGLTTAVGATTLLISLSGSTVVSVWAGSGLSLYWLGLAGAAVVGCDSMRRAAAVPAHVVSILSVVVAVPIAATLSLGQGSIVASDGRTLPAYVSAAASVNPSLATLIVTPQADGGVSARVVRGVGDTLDNQSTILTTADNVTSNDEQVTFLAGNLVSQGGYDPASTLSELGVQYILLSPAFVEPGAQKSPEATTTSSRASAALDSSPVLAHIGPTDRGTLWRFEGGTDASAGAGPDSPFSTPVLIGWAIVFGFALLLSVPTAASRRAAEESPRTLGRRDTREPSRRLTRAERAERKADAEAEASLASEIARDAEAEEQKEALSAAPQAVVDTAPETVNTDTDAERDAVVDTDAGASAADVTTGSNPIAGRTTPTTESEYSHGR
ncbi:glycosyltransferase [Mycetocola zhadangensis]|uniref:glycosyltransferase n=1 Tax=Mycetocola zhadangensis TaxID=1164595 RepID=UPI003A4DC671